MNIYYSTDFTGHWPVPKAMIVMARNEERAIELMKDKCQEHGLTFDGTTHQMIPDIEHALMLSDGTH